MKTQLLFIVYILISFFYSVIFAQDGWIWQNPKPQGNRLNDVFSINENTVVAVGEFGTIIRSIDQGKNWESKSMIGGHEYNFKSVYFTNSSQGWVVGDTEVSDRGDRRISIFNTTNGGEAWEEQYFENGHFRGHLNSVYFVDSNIGEVDPKNWTSV